VVKVCGGFLVVRQKHGFQYENGSKAVGRVAGLVRAGACKVRAPNCGKLSDTTLRFCLTTGFWRRHCASMWFSKRNAAPKLTEELVQRIWDVNGRLKQLEGALNERLEELAKRYRRAEQSEKRLDEKTSAGPCADADAPRSVHPALRARQLRRDAVNSRLGGNLSE